MKNAGFYYQTRARTNLPLGPRALNLGPKMGVGGFGGGGGGVGIAVISLCVKCGYPQNGFFFFKSL